MPISPDVHALVDDAADQACADHGPLTADPIRALAILGEEFGEVARAALVITRPGGNTFPNFASLAVELAQVASVAMLMLGNLDPIYIKVAQSRSKESYRGKC